MSFTQNQQDMPGRKLVIIACIFISHSALAQFSKGDRMVGSGIGTVLFNSASSDITVSSIGQTKAKINSYNISLQPTIGWFINSKTALGVSLNINPAGQSTTYEENGTTFQKDKFNSFNIGAGGFARSYFSDKGSFLPFGQAGINAGLSNLETSGFFYGGSGASLYKDTYSGSSSGGFFANASFLLGVTRKISEHTGLDIYLGYNFSYNKNTFSRTTLTDRLNDGSVDETRENETTTKYTNHGFLLGAGFQVFLGRKK